MRKETISLLSLFIVACAGDDGGASPADAGAGRDGAAPDEQSDAGLAASTVDGGSQDAGSIADASRQQADAASGDAAAPSRALALRLALDAHYRDCRIISAGDFYDLQMRTRFVSDEEGDCAARCDLNADCATLHKYKCESASASPLPGCYQSCYALENPGGFSCTPTGPVVRQNQRCDSRNNDCPQNEDELDCGSFVCADGQRLDSAQVRCNFRTECNDGSDELGCVTTCPL